MQAHQKTYHNWDGSVAKSVRLSRNLPTIIAGPCMLESEELGLRVGSYLKSLCDSHGLPYVFKSSYDKANRTSHAAARGPGLSSGLASLARISEKLNVPVLTDVHTPEEAKAAGAVCDIIQIPAFLCEQRELLLAAAQTQKCVQIKKGQHASPEQMIAVGRFLAEAGNPKTLLCERGSSYGYNNLVVDFRTLMAFRDAGYASVFDATHAAQLPGAGKGQSLGLRHVVPGLARAAAAVGIDALFIEVHENPEAALSDAATQLTFAMAKEVIDSVAAISKLNFL